MKNDVRDRLDDALRGSFSELSPENVPSWDRFEAYRAERQVLASRRSFVLRRGLSVAAAVAAVVVLSLVVWRVTSFSPFEMPQIEMAEVPDLDVKSQNVKVEELVASASRPTILLHSTAAPDLDNNHIENIEVEAFEPDQVQQVIQHKAKQAEQVAQQPKRETPDWQNPDFDRVQTKKDAAQNQERKKRAPRISTGLYAGLGSSIQSSSSSKHVASMPMATMGYRVGKYEGEVDFASAEFTHSFPVSVGASLQIELVRNLNLETGLLYSYLCSQSRKEPSVTYKYTREVHYLGIPVGLSYNFLNNRRLDLYATAGAMVEYAVAAKSTSQVLSQDGAAISSSSNKIDTRGVMVSFNAGVGINVHLTPTVGLYAEPGISTYLDNDTHPVNFRTQSPVQFSLRAGVRVKL